MTDDAPHGDQRHDQDRDDTEPDQDDPGIDAEAWLAERGVRREPIRVRPDTPQGKSDEPPPPRPPAPPPPATEEAAAQPDPDEVGRPEAEEPAEEPDRGGTERPKAEDQVAKAVAYVRRATAKTPMSEGRIRRRLGERDHTDVVIEQALERCRGQGLVDDRSFARALVQEGRDKGHAPLRIRRDLERRELSDEVIEAALDEIGDRDPEAAAFAVARERAERLRGVDAETAFRRLVSYLARRGYTNALSRKVARQAVFDEREDERVAGR